MKNNFNSENGDHEDSFNYPKLISSLNEQQKNSTQIIDSHQKIDLFIVLDISGSMDLSCNKAVNQINIGGAFVKTLIDQPNDGNNKVLKFLIGGILGLGLVKLSNYIINNSDSRLDEAKKHLVLQIKDLIEKERINKVGLITFNHQAKIAYPLSQNFDQIFTQIQKQNAYGATALYDSLEFAIKQLQGSKNPRMLIMTDGQDNSSNTRNFDWARQWFEKDGLKSTFLTICQGDNQNNVKIAEKLKAKYIKVGDECWFSNKFNDDSLRQGINYLL